MTDAIHASLYHVSGYHESCPKTNDSWCQYQKDKVDGTNLFIKKKMGCLSTSVKLILLIYDDLPKPELLQKCLHGKTQKTNESFNVMIWNRIPKATHVGLNNLKSWGL